MKILFVNYHVEHHIVDIYTNEIKHEMDLVVVVFELGYVMRPRNEFSVEGLY